MYAVIQTGGKQYQVSTGSVLNIERVEGNQGDEISFTDVLLLNSGDNTQVGNPCVQGSVVTARILEQTQGEKLIAFKKWRRKGKQWKKGHRQLLSRVQVLEIR